LILYNVGFITVYINVFISKLNTYINLILQFNKLSLNLIMLIVVFILIFIAIQRIYMCIITIFSLTFKLKYLNFINLFIFGFFKVHIVLFYITAIVGYFISLNYNYINLKLKLNRNILFISIAFLLGSLWSLYLFNWGYY